MTCTSVVPRTAQGELDYLRTCLKALRDDNAKLREEVAALRRGQWESRFVCGKCMNEWKGPRSANICPYCEGDAAAAAKLVADREAGWALGIWSGL